MQWCRSRRELQAIAGTLGKVCRLRLHDFMGKVDGPSLIQRFLMSFSAISEPQSSDSGFGIRGDVDPFSVEGHRNDCGIANH